MNQLCKVCGEPAAGFHFGAFTCEGCKSFFGRSYNNLSSISECKNGGGCVINKKNRTSCKACRLRKCLMVGMSKSGSRYGRRSNWFKIHCLLQEQANNIENQQIHNHVNGHRGTIPAHHHDHHSIHHHHHHLGSALAAFPYQHHQAKQLPSPAGPYSQHRPVEHDAPAGDLRQRTNGDSIGAHQQLLHPHLHPHLLHLHRQRAEEHQQLMMMMMEECHKSGNGADGSFRGGATSRSPSVPLGSPHSRDGDRSPTAEKGPRVAHRSSERSEGPASADPSHSTPTAPNGGADLFLRLPFLQAGAFLPTSHFGAAAAAAAVAAAAAAAAASAGTSSFPRFKCVFPGESQHQGHAPNAHSQHHIRSRTQVAENNLHHEMDVYHKRFYLDSVLRSQRSPSGGSGGDEASTNSSCLSSPGGSTSRPVAGGRSSSGNGSSSRCSSPENQEDPMDLSVKGGRKERVEVGEGGEVRDKGVRGEREGRGEGEEEKERRVNEGEGNGEDGVNWGGVRKEKGEEVREEEENGEGEGNPLDLSTKEA